MRTWIPLGLVLVTYRRRRRKPKTAKFYQDHFDPHIRPILGRALITAISAQDITTMFGTLRFHGATSSTLDKVHKTIRALLRYALHEEHIERVPLLPSHTPRYRPQRFSILDDAEVRSFIKATEASPYHALLILTVTTALREGELFGLTVSDVDLRRETLRVRRQLNEDQELGDPKTEGSKRTVALTKVALRALSAHIAERFRENDRHLLFLSPRGCPLNRSNFTNRVFRPLLAVAGLPMIRFHALRYSAATYALSVGVPMEVVQVMCGHDSIKTTIDIYGHVTPGMQAQAARLMDEDLERTG